MTQQELLNILTNELGITRTIASEVLDIIVDVISDELSEKGMISLEGFGVFRILKQPEYISLKSNTGERFLMPPRIEVVFESEDLKLEINFEPDESLRNNINIAFVNFEPTLLNEGVEIPGIQVISDSPEVTDEESPEVIEEKTPEVIEEIVPEVIEKIPELIEDVIIEVRDKVVSEVPVEIKQPHPMKNSPPLKQRINRREIFIPVMGGVAIALAALFFFQQNCRQT